MQYPAKYKIFILGFIKWFLRVYCVLSCFMFVIFIHDLLGDRQLQNPYGGLGFLAVVFFVAIIAHGVVSAALKRIKQASVS